MDTKTTTATAASSTAPVTAAPHVHPGHDTVEIDYEALPPDASLAAHLTAGAFAGIMEHTVMFPIDSLKTRMQIISRTPKFNSSLVQSISKISSTEGAYALWRGVSSVVLGAGPAHAVYFSVFEASKTFLVNNFTTSRNRSRIVTDENHPLIASGAGIAATIASDALMTPFDVLKQRMQASHIADSKSANTVKLFHTAKALYRHEGFSAFFISYPTTLFTSIPFAALNFGFYEYSSSILNPDGNYNPYLHCVSGAVAGGVAAALTNPLDVIKTALQTRGISNIASIKNSTGFTSALKALYREGKMKIFLRGLKPRIVFNVPSTAISWTAYEMAKEVLLKN
ncbi:mitochondrial carrier [Yamadazyma tenuis ATCC 10573]|uniref:Mitochondrial thiamine pyrophosphate carrier 1 n=1 Tax=Candida tenuis (strain ATCC 10573 / BCRC 21748 / CBS 615 / JCM 9827 / NBRC 10315 / NRRL Y-1498 / VKM Y-70) TaxID=590646 RepID=G3BD58_CANTC|nr:mitochondrial carrier [Yamadazyma tenuis ATCC 10573]EGV60245.1 mitochondrial carrier [Yamadazyma tenuis ATCC 10573]